MSSFVNGHFSYFVHNKVSSLVQAKRTHPSCFCSLRQIDVQVHRMLPPGWRSGLGHCIAALAVPPETLGLRPGSVVAGCAREVRGATHNWPSVVRVKEGLAGRDILVSSRTSDSCGGPGAVRANQCRQVHGWLPGWMCAVLKSSAAWLGCASTFVSPEPVREF